MTVVEAVRDRLLAISALTAIVGQRVYSHLFPENAVAKSVRVQRIGTIEDAHLRGASGVARARVQVDSIANSLADAYAIDEAVHGHGDGSALGYWKGDIGSPAFSVLAVLPADVRDVYEPPPVEKYRVMRDYFVWFRT